LRRASGCPGNPIVCIPDKRPPPLVGDPVLPTLPAPILPQCLCNMIHIPCTNGQEPGPPLTDEERRMIIQAIEIIAQKKRRGQCSRHRPLRFALKPAQPL
jgi:hypothetical protein